VDSFNNDDHTGCTSSEQCPVGSGLLSNGSGCEVCPVGRWSSVEDNSQCVDCAVGMATASTGSVAESDCQVCEAGKYGATAGSPCEDCVPGKSNPIEGSVSIDDCLPCAVGKFSEVDGATTCTTCDAGKVSPPLTPSLITIISPSNT
jgi:hypothetical protein